MNSDPKVVYEFGPFRVDPDKQVLLREGQPIAVTPKAFETLLVLMRRSREVVTKEELLKAIWPDSFVEEANLSQHIFMLRKALGDTQEERRYIVTLPGRGYRFAAPVRTLTDRGADRPDAGAHRDHDRGNRA
jgi:DNA-binding winged helix-turn-helix (wHTH) protein